MPRPRDKDYDQKRQQIAAHAASVFAEKGFSGTTNRDIAEAAGISPGLIYWYFENKEDLFFAVFEQFARTRSAELTPRDAADLSVQEFLYRVSSGFLSGIGEPETRTLFRLVLTEVLRFPQPAQQFGNLLAKQTIGTLAHYFEDQVAAGRIEPVDAWLTAQALLGSLVGYAIRKYVFEHADLQQVDDDTMAATVSRLFAHGLTVNAAPPKGTNDERDHSRR